MVSKGSQALNNAPNVNRDIIVQIKKKLLAQPGLTAQLVQKLRHSAKLVNIMTRRDSI